jgi:hypothetical protein
MDEEYEKIREALIALMCVGDEIRYIYSFAGDCHTIYRTVITRIDETELCVLDWGVCGLYRIEHYEGKLYIWERTFQTRRSKFYKMLEILKSEKTTRYDKRV